MIPPRHRPFFGTEEPPPREDGGPMYQYELYHETTANDGVTFVERQLNRGHMMLRRDADDESDKCREFSIGRPDRGEFYSPNHPGNYPNHTECVKLLEGKTQK